LYENDSNPLDEPVDPTPNHGHPDGNPGPGGDDPNNDNDNDNDNAGNGNPPPVPPPANNNDITNVMRFLAQAITANREPPKSKIREPDTFNGSNPKKLHTFLVQCQLTFNDRLTTYANDRTKVNFVISYL
jgi:hypothetical protein